MKMAVFRDNFGSFSDLDSETGLKMDLMGAYLTLSPSLLDKLSEY